MRINKNILSEIANQIDLVNTINGGVSMTSVNIVQKEEQYVINVHTPGINKYAYRVEVVNNMILVYTLIQVEKKDEAIQLPAFVKYFPIPNFVDPEEIHAIHEDGELKVIVPYKNGQSTKQRKIDIDYL